MVLNNMAITYENQGQIDVAEKLFRQAAQTWRECGDTLNEAAALGNLGDVLMLRGELVQAEKQYTTAQKTTESTGSTYVAYDLYSIAAIRLYQGDVSAARQYAARALAMCKARGNSTDTPSILETLGDIQLARADFSGARQSFQNALAIQQQLGKKGSAAENEALLASVSIEEGSFSAAEPTLRKSLAEFQAEKNLMDEVATGTDLSRALLEEGKLSDARQTISEAVALSASSRDPNVRLPVAIQDARVQVSEIASRAKLAKSHADFAAPRRKLQNVLTTAHCLGYYGLECEARLALGELELRENHSAARTQLAALARDAHKHGLELFARKAAALRNSASASAK